MRGIGEIEKKGKGKKRGEDIVWKGIGSEGKERDEKKGNIENEMKERDEIIKGKRNIGEKWWRCGKKKMVNKYGVENVKKVIKWNDEKIKVEKKRRKKEWKYENERKNIIIWFN